MGTVPTNPSIIRSGTGRPAYQFESLGMYRPQSVICSGTGRLVCSIADDHDTLGDWMISLFRLWMRTICSGTGKLNFLDLATRLILHLPASSGTTSIRCIWQCISVSDFLCGFLSRPSHHVPTSPTTRLGD